MTNNQESTLNEIAQLILDFVNGDPDLDEWAWDDFICVLSKDPEVENIRRELCEIEIDFPPGEEGGWCSEAGIQKMIEIANRIRSS